MVVAFVALAGAFSDRLEAALLAHLAHYLYLGGLRGDYCLGQLRHGLVVGAIQDSLGHGDGGFVVRDHEPEEDLVRLLALGVAQRVQLLGEAMPGIRPSRSWPIHCMRSPVPEIGSPHTESQPCMRPI